MIEKPKLLLIVIIVSLTGILGIYFYAVSIESKTMSIADIGYDDLGSFVEVEGHIKEVDAQSGGDLLFALVDYDSGKTMDVRIDSGAAENLERQEKLIPGAKIRVSGLVEDYKGTLQIRVMSSEGIKLLKTAQSNTLSLDVILERPEVFSGVYVVVKGRVWDIETIESIEAITFTLQNSSESGYYSVNCIIFNLTELRDRDDKRVSSGDEIIFEGYFGYYEREGAWQIQSSEGKESLERVEF
ncbi:MAG: hypothetical protein JSW28_03795 [Thermoplasmata archaeon]|nr:MAG: hypothetical protein JSW28_03795 [Thermoplasmata archaeon]